MASVIDFDDIEELRDYRDTLNDAILSCIDRAHTYFMQRYGMTRDEAMEFIDDIQNEEYTNLIMLW